MLVWDGEGTADHARGLNRRAQPPGTLEHELRDLTRYPISVIDEVGYIPFEPEAAKKRRRGDLALKVFSHGWIKPTSPL